MLDKSPDRDVINWNILITQLMKYMALANPMRRQAEERAPMEENRDQLILVQSCHRIRA